MDFVLSIKVQLTRFLHITCLSSSLRLGDRWLMVQKNGLQNAMVCRGATSRLLDWRHFVNNSIYPGFLPGHNFEWNISANIYVFIWSSFWMSIRRLEWLKKNMDVIIIMHFKAKVKSRTLMNFCREKISVSHFSFKPVISRLWHKHFGVALMLALGDGARWIAQIKAVQHVTRLTPGAARLRFFIWESRRPSWIFTQIHVARFLNRNHSSCAPRSNF